ncbi:MAG: S1C family serine protease [Chthoniobacterales bacterium]
MSEEASAPSKGMRSLLQFLVFAGIVGLGLLIFYVAERNGKKGTARPAIQTTFPALRALDGEVTALVGRVLPSVVSISARTENPALDNLLRIQQSLTPGVENGEPQPDLGSGAIVSSEGHILTNFHVVYGANRVDVQLSDGRTLPAKFLGADQQADIAVLKIDVTGLTPLKFTDSNKVNVGQIVFAIGNPLGLQETVTQGIISGKGRRAVSGLSTEFFQTDAAVNPGNSGGPLVNVKGEIVGINNSILLGSSGISFAIPSNVAMRVYEDVVKRGRISRPWFGTNTWPLNRQIAAELKLGTSNGNVVMSVVPDSPAARAGIVAGDVLQEFDGSPVRDTVDIINRLTEMKEGDRVVVTVWRNGQTLKIPITVERQPWQ